MKPHLLFVVGPTASGKSDVAVEIAEACGKEQPRAPELINCDSVQFFAGVDIGAAKPEPELLARAKHHLIGHVPLGGAYTAGDFRRDALKIIEERSQIVSSFVGVGGSGFYVQALEKGMYEVPELSEDIRKQLDRDAEEKGYGVLYEELRTRDAEAAAKIQPQDRYRIWRALEILRSHPDGGTLSQIRAQFEKQKPDAPFTVSKIGIFRSREELRRRITSRTQRMLREGLIEEVEGLRAKGLNDWAPLKSVGYKEVQEFLDGRLTREELEPLIITSTMQLAKRQMTWFKRDASIQWFESKDGQLGAVGTEAEFLGNSPTEYVVRWLSRQRAP